MLATILIILYFIPCPMYGDYADLAPVPQALALLVAARNAMVEQYANIGVWPETLPDGLVSTQGKYTQSIVINHGGGKPLELELSATLRDTGVDRRVAGKTVRSCTREGGKTWQCAAGTVS